MDFNRKIEINNHSIHPQSATYIIAEAGVNHGGDMKLAEKLIDVAVEAGADAVKFQAFKPKNLILSSVGKAPYQKETTDVGESQFDMLTKLQLQKEHYIQLKDYCDSKGITCLITPFDEESLEELESIGLTAYKVASTDTTNLPFLKKIAATGKPVILSTGMSYLQEVELALREMYPINKDVILLQCTANYPIKDEEANLNVVKSFSKKFTTLIGYSDHSVGIGASPYAVALGAKVVEKHFTLDKEADGPDHRASLNPNELIEFVKTIRKVEKFVSDDGIKKPTLSESYTRNSLQKCLVAKNVIPAGAVIKESDLVAKRTGGKGISPIYYSSLVGKVASKKYEIDDIIEL